MASQAETAIPSPANATILDVSESNGDSVADSTHIVLFPFMSKGHTIPIINLAHLLFKRGVTLTIFTTRGNVPFIRSSISAAMATVVDLPFPENISEIPSGVESTDKLPSMSLFVPFIKATKLLQPHFEKALQSLRPPVSGIIYDSFLPWVQLTASKIGVPGFYFSGMNAYTKTLCALVFQHRPHKNVVADDEIFQVEAFPLINLCKRDLDYPFNDPDPKGPLLDFILESVKNYSASQGTILNSFYELEPVFIDFWSRFFDRKAWCAGPLCMISPSLKDEKKDVSTSTCLQWLDEKLAMQRRVLYIAFGTQAEISNLQLREIGAGLERSGVDFLWVVRSREADLGDGFQERVRERGMIVTEWVQQTEILQHESVKGFLSHCGWNSVMESICAKVPILAWPMMADQGLNAKLVEEELKIGMRIPVGGGGGGVVGRETVEEMVRELMVGEKGKEFGKKVEELGETAKKAVEEDGSSWRSLDSFLVEVSSKKEVN